METSVLWKHTTLPPPLSTISLRKIIFTILWGKQTWYFVEIMLQVWISFAIYCDKLKNTTDHAIRNNWIISTLTWCQATFSSSILWSNSVLKLWWQWITKWLMMQALFFYENYKQSLASSNSIFVKTRLKNSSMHGQSLIFF